MRGLKVSVAEYATESPCSVDRQTSVLDAALLMRERGIRHLPVVSAGRVVGILSERDLKAIAFAKDVDAIVVGDLMVKDPYCVHAATSLGEVVIAMAERKIGCAIVTKHGHVAGIFTATDALGALADLLQETA